MHQLDNRYGSVVQIVVNGSLIGRYPTKTPSSNNLLTYEALHNTKKRPVISKRDEFRSRELTLRL